MSSAPLELQSAILRSLLDSLDDAVAVLDESGRIILRNQAAERIARLDAGVTTLNEWARQAGISDDQLPVARALRGESVDAAELFLPSGKGAKGVWLSVTARPLSGHGAVIVMRDVTAHKKSVEALRQSEQRFATFMRHLPGVAFIKDRSGRYIFYNEATEGILPPQHQHQFLGRTDDDI